MITKLGGTPGKLLCGIRIKDANTFNSVTLVQATIRYILDEGITAFTFFLLYLLFGDTSFSRCFFITILCLTRMPAIYDKHKQTFYDKIAKTVVIDYKPS